MMAVAASISSSVTTAALFRSPGGGGFVFPSGFLCTSSLAAGAGFQSPSRNILSTPITFRPPVGASCRRAYSRRRTAAAYNFSKSKCTALGQLYRTRRNSSGLKEAGAVSAKDFFHSPQSPGVGSARATAEVQDGFEDPSSSSSSSSDDGATPVHSNPLDQDRKDRDHDDDLRDLSQSSPGAPTAEDSKDGGNKNILHQQANDIDNLDSVQGKKAELDVGNDDIPQHQQLEHGDLSHHTEEEEAQSSSQQAVAKAYSVPQQGISTSGAAGLDGVKDGKGKRQQQQQKGGGGVPNNFFQGLHLTTSELDLGDEFEQKELEVLKGLLAAQELSPLDVDVNEKKFNEEEAVPAVPMGKFWAESDVQELLSLNGGGSVDLMAEEDRKLKAEQQLQKVMATKDEESLATNEK